MHHWLFLIPILLLVWWWGSGQVRENFLIEVKDLPSEYDHCIPGCGGKGVTGCIARPGDRIPACNGNERVCNSCPVCEWDSIRGRCVPAGYAIRPLQTYPWNWGPSGPWGFWSGWNRWWG
jgi:hypothetical protein